MTKPTRHVPTPDAMLTPPTAAELAAWAANLTQSTALNLSKVWDGVFRPMLDNLPPDTRDELVATINTYAKAQGAPVSTTASPLSATDALKEIRAATSQIAAINKANREFWAQRALDQIK